MFWGAYKGQTTYWRTSFSGSQKWERKEKDPGSFNVGILTSVRKLALFMLREFCRCCDRKRGVNAARREEVRVVSSEMLVVSLGFGRLFHFRRPTTYSFRIVLPSAMSSGLLPLQSYHRAQSLGEGTYGCVRTSLLLDSF